MGFNSGFKGLTVGKGLDRCAQWLEQFEAGDVFYILHTGIVSSDPA